MKYTYYYFCECDAHYNQAVHVSDEENIYQCLRCSTLEGKKSQDEFYIECPACGEKEKIERTVTFEEEHACRRCAIKGKIGLSDEHPFRLQAESKTSGPCTKCGREAWQLVPEAVCCPYCTKTLKVKMSNFWEEC